MLIMFDPHERIGHANGFALQIMWRTDPWLVYHFLIPRC